MFRQVFVRQRFDFAHHATRSSTWRLVTTGDDWVNMGGAGEWGSVSLDALDSSFRWRFADVFRFPPLSPSFPICFPASSNRWPAGSSVTSISSQCRMTTTTTAPSSCSCSVLWKAKIGIRIWTTFTWVPGPPPVSILVSTTTMRCQPPNPRMRHLSNWYFTYIYWEGGCLTDSLKRNWLDTLTFNFNFDFDTSAFVSHPDGPISYSSSAKQPWCPACLTFLTSFGCGWGSDTYMYHFQISRNYGWRLNSWIENEMKKDYPYNLYIINMYRN